MQEISISISKLIIILLLVLSCSKDGTTNSAPDSCSSTTETTYQNTNRSGALTAHERWRGTINVTGDILIGANCKLTIEAGTIVRFSAGADDTSHGSNTGITDGPFPNDPANKPSEMSGIEVWGGELVAQGTSGNLISFTSSNGSPTAGDWHSIAFRSAAGRMTLDYVKIEYAYYGIQVSEVATNNTVLIQNNTINEIVGCGICMGGDPQKSVTLTIANNTISRCGHEGIDLHSNATVIVENNSFLDNRGKFVADPTSVGGNGVVVDKSNASIIQNNIFERNNQGIACITNGTSPSISGNTFGFGGDANDEDIQTCPR